MKIGTHFLMPKTARGKRDFKTGTPNTYVALVRARPCQV